MKKTKFWVEVKEESTGGSYRYGRVRVWGWSLQDAMRRAEVAEFDDNDIEWREWVHPPDDTRVFLTGRIHEAD